MSCVLYNSTASCYFASIVRHCLMKCHTISEANKPSSLYSTNKMDRNSPNVTKIEDTGLKDGVDINDIYPVSTLHQYINMKCNNVSYFTITNCTIPQLNNLLVSTLTSPSDSFVNAEVCYSQNKINEKTQYSDLSTTRSRVVRTANAVVNKRVKLLLAHKPWHPMILECFLKYITRK